MERNLILQEMLYVSYNKTVLAIGYIFVLSIVAIIAFFLNDGFTDPFIIQSFFFFPVWLISFVYFLTRRYKMERSVTLEAMGEYQQAMNMASKYANPLLIAKFRAFYESEINKSNTPTIASNQIVQPTEFSPVYSTKHNSANPTIHIHNTQTQQGPNQNYIQDSVVTDWNQR